MWVTGVYGGSQTVIDDDAIRREQLINNFSCPTMCGCEQKVTHNDDHYNVYDDGHDDHGDDDDDSDDDDVQVSSQVPSLPFHRVPSRYRYLNPGKFLNGSKILDLI